MIFCQSDDKTFSRELLCCQYSKKGVKSIKICIQKRLVTRFEGVYVWFTLQLDVVARWVVAASAHYERPARCPHERCEPWWFLLNRRRRQQSTGLKDAAVVSSEIPHSCLQYSWENRFAAYTTLHYDLGVKIILSDIFPSTESKRIRFAVKQ